MLYQDKPKILYYYAWQHFDTVSPKALAGLIDAMAGTAPSIFPKYGLDSDLLIAHAMAQFSHESGAGNEMVENINYTAKRACQVWPSRFRSEADADAMATGLGPMTAPLTSVAASVR